MTGAADRAVRRTTIWVEVVVPLTEMDARVLAKQAVCGERARAAVTRGDWGVPLLAALIAAKEPGWRMQAHEVTIAWVAERRQGVPAGRLFGSGLAGLLAGLTHAESIEPRLARITDLTRAKLASWAQLQQVDPDGPLSVDYDVVTGVSGAVLALAAAPRCHSAEIRPAIAYLLSLCRAPDLAGLCHRAAEPNPRLSWNAGIRNHGLAHGMPGILAALIAAQPFVTGPEAAELQVTVRRLAEYLRDQAYRDARGVISWPRGSGHEAAKTTDQRRQAWCYGTPGVAWQLFASGRLLGDPELCAFANDAMSSLCYAWDDDYYLRGESRSAQLSICHGAPGTLAVARMFAGRAGLPEAAGLARHLDDALTERIPAWCETTHAAATMLDGTAGTLALLAASGAGIPCLSFLGLAGRDIATGGPHDSHGAGFEDATL